MSVRVCGGVLFVLLAGVLPALAQTPTPPPPSPLKYSFGGGVALTSGNRDTSTYNASYSVAFTPAGNRRVFKSDGFFLRGRTSGELSNDRLGINVREEIRTSERFFVFGQNQYARDRFKRIQFLLAPTGGVGITTVNTPRTTVALDAGLGGVWEKNPDADVRASGALTLHQRLTQTISTTTTLTQTLRGLWRTEDMADAYYQLALTAALAINSRVQLKVEGINTYNTKPAGEGVKNNDVSMVFALVFKN